MSSYLTQLQHTAISNFNFVRNESIQFSTTCITKALNYISEDVIEAAILVHEIAIQVLKTVTATLLFLSNSSLFVIGGIAGFVVPDTMCDINQRIAEAWDRLKPRAKAAVVFASVFAWPIVFAAGAFFVGAQVAIALQKGEN